MQSPTDCEADVPDAEQILYDIINPTATTVAQLQFGTLRAYINFATNRGWYPSDAERLLYAYSISH